MFVKLVLILLFEKLAVVGHDANRLAQIVTDGIGELLQIAIGALQFVGLPSQRFFGRLALSNVGQGDDAAQQLTRIAPQRSSAQEQCGMAACRNGEQYLDTA